MATTETASARPHCESPVGAPGVSPSAPRLSLSLSLVWTGSAMADPDNPATSDEAQQAYLDSSQRAGALNEDVLVAQETKRQPLPPSLPPPIRSRAPCRRSRQAARCAGRRRSSQLPEQGRRLRERQLPGCQSEPGCRCCSPPIRPRTTWIRSVPLTGSPPTPSRRSTPRWPRRPRPRRHKQTPPPPGRSGKGQGRCRRRPASAQQATADVTAGRPAWMPRPRATRRFTTRSPSRSARRPPPPRERANEAANAAAAAADPAQAAPAPAAANRSRSHRDQLLSTAAPRRRRRGRVRRPPHRPGVPLPQPLSPRRCPRWAAVCLRRRRPERVRLLGSDVVGLGAGRGDHSADLGWSGGSADRLAQ